MNRPTHNKMVSLDVLVKLITDKKSTLEDWFGTKWSGLKPLPYFSCDVRHAHFKVGVVDTNVFPGGFNNLCATYTHQTAAAFKNYFEVYYPAAGIICIFAEAHTRNKFYLMNVAKLKALLEEAGLTCFVVLPEESGLSEMQSIVLDDQVTLELHQVKIGDHADGQKTLVSADLSADLILSNNDFSAGIPHILRQMVERVIPTVNMGWHRRRKSQHFELYQTLCTDFAKTFGFDPWLICPIQRVSSDVSAGNLAALAGLVDEMINDIQIKYTEYGIDETPYVFIKNDAGTYGLGVISVSRGNEVLNLNRKRREKLFATKSDHEHGQFLVQEGIPTVDRYSEFPIEPVIYGVGAKPIGGFFRIHEARNAYESLNTPGMSFSCLCLHKLDEPHEAPFLNCSCKHELVDGAQLLARIAALAIAMEASSLLTNPFRLQF